MQRDGLTVNGAEVWTKSRGLKLCHGGTLQGRRTNVLVVISDAYMSVVHSEDRFFSAIDNEEELSRSSQV